MGIETIKDKVAEARAAQQQQPNQNVNQGAQGQSANFGYSQSQSQNTSFSFYDQSAVFGNGPSALFLSTNLALVKENIEKKLNATNLDFNVVPLDRSNTDLPVDVVVLLLRNKADQKFKEEHIKTGAYALVITDKDVVIDEQTVTDHQGRSFNFAVQPSLLVGLPDFQKSIINIVSRQTGVDSSELFYAGGQVVFRENVDMTKDDQNNSVIVNAANACRIKGYENYGKMAGHIVDINVGVYKPNQENGSETLSVERRLTSGVSLDAAGIPVRTDWNLNVHSRINRGNDQRNGLLRALSQGNETVFSMTGYQDVELIPAEGKQATGNIWDRGLNGMNQYAAEAGQHRIVMPIQVFTSIVPSQYQTLANILFGLGVGIGSLTTDYWYIIEAMDPAKRPADWEHNIGGLGYEVAVALGFAEKCPFPTPANMPEGQVYNNDIFIRTVARYFSQATAFALDVQLGSSYHWMYADFVKAAFEDDNEVSAQSSFNSKILAHANHLFNGQFLSRYTAKGGSGRVCTTRQNVRMPAGEYVDGKTRTVRSLQDVDRLFMNNWANGDVSNMIYANSLIDARLGNLPTEVGVGTQMEVIRQILPNAKVYGYTVRVVFDNIFVETLMECMVEMGPALVCQNNAPQINNQHYGVIGGSVVHNLNANFLKTQYGYSVNQGRSDFFSTKY